MMNDMKNLFIAIIPLFLLGSLFAQREQPEVRTLDSKFSKSTKCLNPEYLLFSAKIKGDKKPALLIYLHGAGGVGSDVKRLQGQARALLEGINKFKKGPGHIVVPQCSRTRKVGGRGTWEASDLDLLLKGLSSSLNFDSKRIYLTGNSMAGMPDDNRGLFAKQLRVWKDESGYISELDKYMPVGYGRPVNEEDNSWESSDTSFGGFGEVVRPGVKFLGEVP